MTTELGAWARSGGAPKIGPYRTIEARYEETGGAAVWGAPLHRGLTAWTFADGHIVFDPRSETAREIRGGSPLAVGR
ncbi:hypothetical protein AFL01nite_14870 [Aeromicrobium flavum]|uniref:Uncharacterized protein n=1 Tax=Aeromicrobium flavum TaxID=416568 RepID=A0A512HUR8_9ACTN|nr:hypothetical protein [Aeromicrobium flavum]GEO89160.1 hypothetical protein AFL01nite_14870 [Aeromicrobium flavum]